MKQIETDDLVFAVISDTEDLDASELATADAIVIIPTDSRILEKQVAAIRNRPEPDLYLKPLLVAGQGPAPSRLCKKLLDGTVSDPENPSGATALVHRIQNRNRELLSAQ